MRHDGRSPDDDAQGQKSCVHHAVRPTLAPFRDEQGAEGGESSLETSGEADREEELRKEEAKEWRRVEEKEKLG